MGKWSLKYFNQEVLSENCILFAGTTKDNLKAKILSNYQHANELQHCLFEAYECINNESKALLIFQLYSAAMTADILHYLNDGKVKNILFIGAAYSFINTHHIGDIIIPTAIKPMDGLVDYIENVHIVHPSQISLNFVKNILEGNHVKYIEGSSISIPSVFVKPKINAISNEIISMEMECAALYYYSAKLGINCVAVQIVSDKEGYQLYEDQNARYNSIDRISKILSTQKRLV